MDKKEIRKLISDMKNNMSLKEIESLSEKMTDIFCATDDFKNASCIFAYMSYNQEVKTRGIIEMALASGKRIAVPKVYGRDIKFKYINSVNDCINGYMGIPEPDEGCLCADNVEKKVLLLMPGLAFDKEGNRIGYGGGYYDRYLNVHRDTEFTKIALGYDFQLMEKIENEAFDVKADIVITPSAIIRKK